MTIADNFARLQERVASAKSAAGREVGDAVEIMLAAKYQPVEALLEALAAGATTFGHNIVQQLVDAEEGLLAAGAPEHRTAVIGHVQSNKITAAMEHASRIDTVDSLKTARQIARRQRICIDAGEADGPFPILVQVNSAGAESQFGAAPESLLELVSQISELDEVRIDGLMTIGANSADESAVHRSFTLTRELGEDLRALPGLANARELSMGMSGDLEIAISEGATIVRVGTAVFGPRPRP